MNQLNQAPNNAPMLLLMLCCSYYNPTNQLSRTCFVSFTYLCTGWFQTKDIFPNSNSRHGFWLPVWFARAQLWKTHFVHSLHVSWTGIIHLRYLCFKLGLKSLNNLDQYYLVGKIYFYVFIHEHLLRSILLTS